MGAVIDRFATAGVRFDLLPGDRLLAHGDLTDELRDAIRTHKPAILVELVAANDRTEAADLRELVALVAAEWPEDQRAEALAAALADPADALTSYRALAADLPTAPMLEPDDRRTCGSCRNLSPGGRCLAAWRGESLGDGIATGRTYEPDCIRPQRCAAYLPGPDDADRRIGAERWPTLVAEKAEHNAHPRKANADTASQPI